MEALQRGNASGKPPSTGNIAPVVMLLRSKSGEISSRWRSEKFSGDANCMSEPLPLTVNADTSMLRTSEMWRLIEVLSPPNKTRSSSLPIMRRAELIHAIRVQHKYFYIIVIPVFES